MQIRILRNGERERERLIRTDREALGLCEMANRVRVGLRSRVEEGEKEFLGLERDRPWRRREIKIFGKVFPLLLILRF